MEPRSKNITVAVTPMTYTRARVWAAERNVSLSAVVAKFLDDLPQLRSARNFSKADLPRRVKKHRRAALYIQIEQPAHHPHSAFAPDPKIPEACVSATAPPANPAATADAARPISS